jgi:uncharacterized membrane protein
MFTTLAVGMGSPSGVMLSAVGILILLFWLAQVLDVIRRRFSSPGTKVLWLAAVIVFNIFGAVVYYAAGRSQGTLPAA